MQKKTVRYKWLRKSTCLWFGNSERLSPGCLQPKRSEPIVLNLLPEEEVLNYSWRLIITRKYIEKKHPRDLILYLRWGILSVHKLIINFSGQSSVAINPKLNKKWLPYLVCKKHQKHWLHQSYDYLIQVADDDGGEEDLREWDILRVQGGDDGRPHEVDGAGKDEECRASQCQHKSNWPEQATNSWGQICR